MTCIDPGEFAPPELAEAAQGRMTSRRRTTLVLRTYGVRTQTDIAHKEVVPIQLHYLGTEVGLLG